MKGILVRNSDNRVLGTLEATDMDIISASTLSGQTFYANVDVEKDRMRFAYYDGESLSYIKTMDELNTEKLWIEVRRDRDALLAASDWTQSPDSPMTDLKRSEWASYRQALRDMTSGDDPAKVTWPSKPT